MSAKHTPGPWRESGELPLYIHGFSGALVARAHESQIMAHGEAAANAKLIAAAPFLLAFAQDFVDAFGDLTVEDVFAMLAEDPSVLTDFILKARTALRCAGTLG